MSSLSSKINPYPWISLLSMGLLPVAAYFGLVSDYTLHIGIVILVWALLTTSLNLIVGYTGPESFAHGAMFGIGAFSSAIIVSITDLPLLLCILIGAFAAMLSALFIAAPSLRLKGTYFAIITIAFQVIYQDSLLIFSDWTGGINGLNGIVSYPTVLFLEGIYSNFYFVYAVAIASIFVLYRIVNSRLGDIFMMIKQDEEFAAHLGYYTTGYKIMSFMISAFFAGLAGSLFVHHNGFMGPTLSNLFISFQALVFVIIGGAGTFWPPILAAGVLQVFQEVFSLASVYSSILISGLFLVIILTAPDGLARVEYRKLFDKGRQILTREGEDE